MTIIEVRETLEEIENFEMIIDDVLKFKNNIKNFESISIEGTWLSKKEGKDKRVEITTSEKEEIKILKPFLDEYEKYLLKKYNSKIEALKKIGIEIESKYIKEKNISKKNLCLEDLK
ncbi:hypothetical protein [Fusobacterium varium]|uniref:hypothetical protein n=1 Tax=Fusobacterium varium TaxID=856 RepID=UPI000E3FFC78|nr:hypothetical protein [Fusobacterium varium]RGJ30401.1 hypothetical protein DXD66_04925 [Fusobacterium varium]